MEKLALSIQSKVNSTYFLFANDILLFCEATPEQVEVVMETLDDFCMASGIKVNVK